MNWTNSLVIICITALVALLGCDRGYSDQAGQSTKDKDKEIMASAAVELATLGGGCFWCVEAVYEDLRGVVKVTSGYSGGHLKDPSYEQVSSGKSGHAEVVQIGFDPKIISFAQLLEVFFHLHDPTTKDQQGNDHGPQYRSVIFYHSEDQRRIAEEVLEKIGREKLWKAPIVTELKAFDKFYSAEDYHQNYYRENPNQPYCAIVIAPKMQKLYKEFGSLLKSRSS